MDPYVRCKTCEFVMKKGKLGEVCPACAVPAKMLEDFKPRVSEKRMKILELDIHPVIVHAPQAFAFSIVVFSIVALIARGALRANLETTIVVLGILLPFTVLGAIGSGLFDGKIRYKKLKTPLLIRKIILGSTFFVISAVGFVITVALGADHASYLALMLIISGAGFICSSFLGIIGSRLRCAAFPG